MTRAQNYNTITVNLVAGVSQIVASGESFVVLSASPSGLSALRASLDGSEPQGAWPFGVELIPANGPANLRVLSSVTQTITIAFTSGGTRIRDNRFAPGAGVLDVNVVSPNPLPISVADGADVALGAEADAASENPATAASLISLIKGWLSKMITGGAALAPTATRAMLPIGGSDGTTARMLSTDTGGRAIVVGSATVGAAPVGNPVAVAGDDGTNMRRLRLDSTGRAVCVGAAASGSAPLGAPLLISGSDGANVRSVLTDTGGRIVTTTSSSDGSGIVGGVFPVAGINPVGGTQTQPAVNSSRAAHVVESVRSGGNRVLVGANVAIVAATANQAVSTSISSGATVANASGILCAPGGSLRCTTAGVATIQIRNVTGGVDLASLAVSMAAGERIMFSQLFDKYIEASPPAANDLINISISTDATFVGVASGILALKRT